jgi:hypothetical protein
VNTPFFCVGAAHRNMLEKLQVSFRYLVLAIFAGVIVLILVRRRNSRR